MAFKQFTKCIQAKDHNTTDRRVQAFVAAAVTTALVSIYPIIVAATSDGSWWCLLLLAPFFYRTGWPLIAIGG